MTFVVNGCEKGSYKSKYGKILHLYIYTKPFIYGRIDVLKFCIMNIML